MIKHKTITRRRVVTIQELAEVLGVHRHTMARYVQKLNMHDVLEVLRFVRSWPKE